MLTFSHTGNTMIRGDRLKSLLDLVVSIEPYLVNQTIKAITRELVFDFAEDTFYRVELRAIADIEHWPDVKLLVNRLNCSCFMNL